MRVAFRHVLLQLMGCQRPKLPLNFALLETVGVQNRQEAKTIAPENACNPQPAAQPYLSRPCDRRSDTSQLRAVTRQCVINVVIPEE